MSKTEEQAKLIQQLTKERDELKELFSQMLGHIDNDNYLEAKETALKLESTHNYNSSLQAEKKKVEELSKKVIAGYLFNGRYYKYLHELRGKTMSEDNCATTLYY